ncbi:MAG: tRNA (adenosine(37)-N6)-dimethylallyltransferase MiaA [Candidatus Promineifilaceae bacterium]
MNKLLAIIGPTAIGKTSLSLEVANRVASEVLSADSRLFYRHMDIGTAKPLADERGDIPHHFIDIVEPDQTVTLGDYQDRCFARVDALHAAHKLPILVGGTGQYAWAVLEGWGIPRVPPHPALRSELEQRSSIDLHAELTTRDPVAAAKIHPNNVRRVIRALEVCIVTNRPISELQAKSPPPYDIKLIGLTTNRESLYQRIDDRVDQMMAAGFLDEMARLKALGFGRKLPSMSGLGYAQLWEYLDGELSLPDAVQRIKYETHRFVRHQYNWFKPDDQRINWFDIANPDYPNNALGTIASWLEG